MIHEGRLTSLAAYEAGVRAPSRSGAWGARAGEGRNGGCPVLRAAAGAVLLGAVAVLWPAALEAAENALCLALP